MSTGGRCAGAILSRHSRVIRKSAGRIRAVPTAVLVTGRRATWTAGDMAAEEQSGVAGASAEVIESLARHNHDYEEKFGFIFIVCATGKSAAQMLQLIRERIGNDRAGEIANAAEEQRKITQIRIRKMFALSE